MFKDSSQKRLHRLTLLSLSRLRRNLGAARSCERFDICTIARFIERAPPHSCLKLKSPLCSSLCGNTQHASLSLLNIFGLLPGWGESGGGMLCFLPRCFGLTGLPFLTGKENPSVFIKESIKCYIASSLFPDALSLFLLVLFLILLDICTLICCFRDSRSTKC